MNSPQRVRIPRGQTAEQPPAPVVVVDRGTSPEELRAEVEDRARRHGIEPEAVQVVRVPWLAR